MVSAGTGWRYASAPRGGSWGREGVGERREVWSAGSSCGGTFLFGHGAAPVGWGMLEGAGVQKAHGCAQSSVTPTLAPTAAYLSGLFRKSTTSKSSCLDASQPATSSNVTPVLARRGRGTQSRDHKGFASIVRSTRQGDATRNSGEARCQPLGVGTLSDSGPASSPQGPDTLFLGSLRSSLLGVLLPVVV